MMFGRVVVVVPRVFGCFSGLFERFSKFVLVGFKQHVGGDASPRWCFGGVLAVSVAVLVMFQWCVRGVLLVSKW